jgi:hypothetical protein
VNRLGIDLVNAGESGNVVVLVGDEEQLFAESGEFGREQELE